jgi:hypothetical protein
VRNKRNHRIAVGTIGDRGAGPVEFRPEHSWDDYAYDFTGPAHSEQADRFEDFEVKVTFDLTAVVLQFDKARDAYIAESND